MDYQTADVESTSILCPEMVSWENAHWSHPDQTFAINKNE